MQNVPRCAFWGAVGIGFKSKLVVFPPEFRLDGESYKRKVLVHVVPQLLAQKRQFQQDGARCHWAKTVTGYLGRKGVSLVDGHPPYSPDMSPIERVWALLKARVARRKPRTQEQLEAYLTEEWERMPQATVDRVCKGWVKTLARVVRRHGRF